MDQEHTLHLYAVTAADAGTYICTAQSQLGSAAATARVQVEGQCQCTGSSRGLSVGAILVGSIHVGHPRGVHPRGSIKEGPSKGFIQGECILGAPSKRRALAEEVHLKGSIQEATSKGFHIDEVRLRGIIQVRVRLRSVHPRRFVKGEPVQESPLSLYKQDPTKQVPPRGSI